MRALVISNMRPTAAHPARGVFVRDQVAALQRLEGLDVELAEGLPGGRGYVDLARALRRHGTVDVVHAHFGLTAYPGLALRGRPVRVLTVHGTDVRHPRTGRLTRAVLPRMDLVAAVSDELAAALPARAGRGDRPVAVLPCGVSLERFRPLPRTQARAALGLAPDEPLLLFPADPARAGKRVDRAREVAGDVRLATLGDVAPDDVALWINAANAVLVPSEAEGFGLAVLEALACDVPVLATPVGEHPRALQGIAGTLCAPFEAGVWRAALAPHLAAADPRVAGRERAAAYGADAMALRAADAWRALLGGR